VKIKIVIYNAAQVFINKQNLKNLFSLHYLFYLVDGTWSSWNGWSTCKSCNDYRSRNRTCLNKYCNGNSCLGSAEQIESCLYQLNNCTAPGFISRVLFYKI
jgi:hypothetical protein